MIGVPISQQTKDQFIDMVSVNILEYIPSYYEELRILEQER